MELFRWLGALADSDLSPGAKLVGFVLALDFDNNLLRAHPSHERLARRSGRDKSTVIRNLAKLEQRGFVEIEPGGGRGRSTRYRGTFPSINSRTDATVSEDETVASAERNSRISQPKQSHPRDTNYLGTTQGTRNREGPLSRDVGRRFPERVLAAARDANFPEAWLAGLVRETLSDWSGDPDLTEDEVPAVLAALHLHRRSA